MIYDFLVIGSGLAGLSFALRAQEHGKVALITKSALEESNTKYAQGGIAISFTPEQMERHIEDTIRAGDGLCDEKIVRMVVESSPEAFRELVEWGVEFDFVEGKIHLTREGGHSENRVAHWKDTTGLSIVKALAQRVRESKNIDIFENRMAIDLITRHKFIGKDGENECYGAYVLDKETGEVQTIFAKVTVLATGGGGKVYLITSNPDTATGDGIAMAYRAGAKIANLEFIQFHPTVLYHPKAKNFLISEALRGEGGILINSKGERFMQKYHPAGELAPRDIVARAIDMELKRSGDECVYLDITHLGADYIKRRFPTIYSKCLEFGIDITREPIPVVPAAHFFCGGVMTDEWGETSVRRLFAVGEVAYTGLHGANRLASNSLLECVVFSKRALEKAVELYSDAKIPVSQIPPWRSEATIPQDEKILISHTWDEIRRLMWNYVGVVRSNKRLERALDRIRLIKKEVMEDYWKYYVTADLIELRNITIVAELVIQSALWRKESRGTHYTIDYPFKNDIDFKRNSIVFLS